MKTSIMAVVVGLVMALFAVQPARAMEPMGAAVIGLITVGSHVARDLVANGTLPDAPPACRMEKVQAANGNYFYDVVAKDNPSNCR